MKDLTFINYLQEPTQVKAALDLLDKKCIELSFEDLYVFFEKELGIQNGEGFPIPVVTISGATCRARINDHDFLCAETTDQIGAKLKNVSQGRANAANYPVFYGANCKKTAAYEVLQSKQPGRYIVTIGCWENENNLVIANLVDSKDPDFKKLTFVHSDPQKFMNTWPEKPRQSANLIMDFFKDKFKMPYTKDLYNITNVIAAMCFSLDGVDGIGYGATSDNFEGFNVALKDPSKLKCVSVERWLIEKNNLETFNSLKIQTGMINPDRSITW